MRNFALGLTLGTVTGVLLCKPEYVTKLVLEIKEHQVEAQRELVRNVKVLDEDLQAFLKHHPTTNK
jgi:hypothetical protein